MGNAKRSRVVRSFLWVTSLVFLSLSSFTDARASEADPFEPLNRRVFAFNDATDKHLLRPIAVMYTNTTPSPVQTGIGNALRNLRDVNYAANALLQGRVQDGLANTGRLFINSTLGLFGLFDVASSVGLQSRPADYGQTLATWGAPAGPYLVLPLIGPSSLRDSVGFAVDTAALTVPGQVSSTATKNTLWGSAAIDTRADLLSVDGLMSGDRYIFLRDAYLQRRGAVTGDAVGIDPFGSDEDVDWDSAEF